MHDWAERAVSAAKALGDAAADGGGARDARARGRHDRSAGERARSHRAEAAALVDGLSDDELSLRLDAAAWLAARRALPRPLRRGRRAREPRPRGSPARPGRASSSSSCTRSCARVWYVRGKLAEATELLDGAIEAARLLGQHAGLAGNLFNRSVVALAVGDLDIALATAEEGVELTRDLDEGFVAAWAAVRLAGVLLETGQPDGAVELLLGSRRRRGADAHPRRLEGVLPRTADALLARARTARRGRARGRLRRGQGRGRAASARRRLGRPSRRRSRPARRRPGPRRRARARLRRWPLTRSAPRSRRRCRARSRAARSLKPAEPDRAIAELQRAATALDACGALRYRDQAERELGKLGHRIHRRTRPGKTDGAGLESLTERELQVARLVVDRKTNPEIAAELFLSQKTVETHLRHIFHKMDVAIARRPRTRRRARRPSRERPTKLSTRFLSQTALRKAESRDQGARSGGPPDVGAGAHGQTRT